MLLLGRPSLHPDTVTQECEGAGRQKARAPTRRLRHILPVPHRCHRPRSKPNKAGLVPAARPTKDTHKRDLRVWLQLSAIWPCYFDGAGGQGHTPNEGQGMLQALEVPLPESRLVVPAVYSRCLINAEWKTKIFDNLQTFWNASPQYWGYCLYFCVSEPAESMNMWAQTEDVWNTLKLFYF